VISRRHQIACPVSTPFLHAVRVLRCFLRVRACRVCPGTIIDDSGRQAEVQMQHIADAVKSPDAAALKKLFSVCAREKATDMDSGLKYSLSVFPSDRKTWKSEGTPSSEDWASSFDLDSGRTLGTPGVYVAQK
jgi:hypothetical protein